MLSSILGTIAPAQVAIIVNDVEAVKKKRLLTALAAGVFLSLCVMSYPPSLIFAAFVFVYVFLKSKGRRKEFAAVSGVCLVSGILYMARIFSYMSAGELKESIHMMLASDVTHGGGFSKILGYGKDTLIILIFIAGFYGLSYLISGVLKKKELLVPLSAVMVFSWRNIHILLRNDTYPVEYTFAGILIVLLIAFYSGIREKLYSEEDKKVINGFEVFEAPVSVSVKEVPEISEVEPIENEKEVYRNE